MFPYVTCPYYIMQRWVFPFFLEPVRDGRLRDKVDFTADAVPKFDSSKASDCKNRDYCASPQYIPEKQNDKQIFRFKGIKYNYSLWTE